MADLNVIFARAITESQKTIICVDKNKNTVNSIV